MITPFADDETQSAVGALGFENGRRAIVISGHIEITRDQVGLKLARELKAHIDAVTAALEANGQLPPQVEPEPAGPVTEVKNPFA